jgi:APA family basic amino acid/polyamine antiporter
VSGQLRRELGLADAVAIGLGAIIGAGIFVVSGVAAGVAGPAFLVSLMIAGAVATANALSSAQLAAVFPQSGGTYEYAYRLLHPWAGFAAGWLFLASKVAAAGTVALGLGEYLAPLLPGVPPRALAVLAVGAFTLLNRRGVRRSSRVNLIIVGLTMLTLASYAVLALPRVSSDLLRPFAPGGARAILHAAALLFFAYTGYARIATLGEEVRDPAETIPRAIIITIVLAIALYAAVALAAVGTVGSAVLSASGAPIASAAEQVLGSRFALVVRASAATAMLGVLLSQLLAQSRMLFAMARRGDMPRVFAHVDARHGVPDRAVLAVGALSALVAATGALAGVAAAAAFTILCYYALANLAALRLPAAQKRFPDAVAVFGLAGCAGLAAFLDLTTMLVGLMLLAVGAAWRFALLALRRPR